MQPTAKTRVLGTAACATLFVAVALTRGTWPGEARGTDDKPPTPAAPVAVFVVGPYLQYATKTAITVMAETATPLRCTVRYGLSSSLKESAVGPPGTMHELRLDNLQPNAKYFYQVTCRADGAVPVASKLLTFTTACDSAQAFSFTVIGDTQKNPAVTGKLAKLMWERRPHFVLHMGDVVDNGPDRKEWTDELFKPCAELFSRVPLYPCIGNHEKNHAHYYQYFSLPPPENYYQFSYGNADFFSMDSNQPIFPGTKQYEWLDKALSASTARWKFCYHHHPCYTSDADDYGDTFKGNSALGELKVKALIPLYEKHKVDLAMNGHVHFYERTHPIKAGKVDRAGGVVYLTSGGGGGKLEGFGPTPTFFKNQNRVDYHYCYFSIFDNVLECKVFDHEDRLFDTFEIKK